MDYGKLENYDAAQAVDFDSLITVKLTFQDGNYKGEAFTKVGGNVTGGSILHMFADDDEDELADTLTDQENTDCRFPFAELGDDDEGRPWYRMVLSDTKGNTLAIEDELWSLPQYLVGVEIVDVTSKEKK